VVTELASLLLDEPLEPTLIYAEMVLLQKPARCDFVCEVMRLGEGYIRDPHARGESGTLIQDEAIQDVCSFVQKSNAYILLPFLEGFGVSTQRWSTAPGRFIASVFGNSFAYSVRGPPSQRKGVRTTEKCNKKRNLENDSWDSRERAFPGASN